MSVPYRTPAPPLEDPFCYIVLTTQDLYDMGRIGWSTYRSPLSAFADYATEVLRRLAGDRSYKLYLARVQRSMVATPEDLWHLLDALESGEVKCILST